MLAQDIVDQRAFSCTVLGTNLLNSNTLTTDGTRAIEASGAQWSPKLSFHHNLDIRGRYKNKNMPKTNPRVELETT